MKEKMPPVAPCRLRAQEKLILLMRAKEDAMTELGIIEPGYYFSDEDACDIAGWPEEQAQRAWDIMLASPFPRGLRSSTCPWCLVYYKHYGELNDYERCGGCGYGDRHGTCGVGVFCTTWESVISALDRHSGRLDDEPDRYLVFTPQVYADILDVIESIERRA